MNDERIDRHILPSDPWSVKEWDFPTVGTPDEKLAFLLNYAVLAPSGYGPEIPATPRCSVAETLMTRTPYPQAP